MKRIIIKCFETPGKKYFYDRFLNSVVAVNESEYEILKEVERSGQLPLDNSLKKFTDLGFLQKALVEKIEHPEAVHLKFLSEHYLENLILQVTQQCNLRCKYCAYSGNYYNRTHSSQRMSFEVAKEAIDFYLKKSDKTNKLTLAFYGGEPLLEFDLIKKCVDYIIAHKGDQAIDFPMTTNGTLLDLEKIGFLVKHKFTLMISLDGERESHDANRKFLSGEGSFDLVMQNLKALKKYDEEYYRKYVLFNCVISSTTDLEKVYEFYMNTDLFVPGMIHFSFVNSVDIKDENIMKINRRNERVYNLLLSLAGLREWDILAKINRASITDEEMLYERLHRHSSESRSVHHGGPCMPGIKRLFVDVNGMFFPCERVSEENPQMCIGSLEGGFNYENMDFFINHGKLIEQKCLDCWNLRMCSFCLNAIEHKNEKITGETLSQHCFFSKSTSEDLLKRLCMLTEFGYRGNEDLRVFK